MKRSSNLHFSRITRTVFILLTCLWAGRAGAITINGAGGSFEVPVKSFQESRFRSVVKQQFDFSCGSAALATLLTYHYDLPLNEQEVFTRMYEVGDQKKIQENGFSMLDMKKYLEANGYHADGFRLSLEKLAELGVPAITLLNRDGYLHFVVIKGVSSREVLFGDPAMGVRAMPRPEFELMWNGILFVIRSHPDIGRGHFNTEKEWLAWQRAPQQTAVSRASLSSLLLSLPVRSDF